MTPAQSIADRAAWTQDAAELIAQSVPPSDEVAGWEARMRMVADIAVAVGDPEPYSADSTDSAFDDLRTNAQNLREHVPEVGAELADELVGAVEELGRVLDDLAETDPAMLFEQLSRVDQLLRLIVRRVQRKAFNRPDAASEFLLQEIVDRTDAPFTATIGISRKDLQRWSRHPQAMTPAEEQRLRLVAQLSFDLLMSRDADGVASWFTRPRQALDGRCPADLLHDLKGNKEPLRSLARSTREQLAV